MKVYLINAKNTNKYKIGVSANIQKRLKSLQTANSDELEVIFDFDTKHNRALETALHTHYKNFGTRGEWFIFDELQVALFLNQCMILEARLDLLFEQNTYYQEQLNKKKARS